MNDIVIGHIENFMHDKAIGLISVQEEKTEISNIVIKGASHSCVQFVQYSVGNLAVYKYDSNYIAISDEFSGCAMAHIRYNQDDYITHIAIDNSGNWKDTWNEFVYRNGIEVRNLFLPFYGKIQEKFRKIIKKTKDPFGITCVGVIFDNKCYSCIYDKTTRALLYIIEWGNTNHNSLNPSLQNEISCKTIK